MSFLDVRILCLYFRLAIIVPCITGSRYECVQANVWCTANRAKKVVIGLTSVTITFLVVQSVCSQFAIYFLLEIYLYIERGVLPVSILVINLIVVYKVRRSSHRAATNLGLQQHHQSTSSNSAVPTVTLVTTSLVYVALCGTWTTFFILPRWIDKNSASYAVVNRCLRVVSTLLRLIFAYNFYVYMITSYLFRSELRKLFCCFFSSSSSSSSAARTTTHGQTNPSIV